MLCILGSTPNSKNNMFFVHWWYDQFSKCLTGMNCHKFLQNYMDQAVWSSENEFHLNGLVRNLFMEHIVGSVLCVCACVFNILDGRVHAASTDSFFLLLGYWGSTLVLCNKLLEATTAWWKLLVRTLSALSMWESNETVEMYKMQKLILLSLCQRGRKLVPGQLFFVVCSCSLHLFRKHI